MVTLNLALVVERQTIQNIVFLARRSIESIVALKSRKWTNEIFELLLTELPFLQNWPSDISLKCYL